MSTPQELAGQAWDYFQLGATENAEQLFREAVAADPQYAEAWCFLGIVCKARGKLDDAVQSYRQALRLQPTYFEPLNNLGSMRLLRPTCPDCAARRRGCCAPGDGWD